MIKPLDIAVAFMFADTWSRVFVIWLDADTHFLAISSFLLLFLILDVWIDGYCALRKKEDHSND